MLNKISEEAKEQRAQKLLKLLKNVYEETKDDFVPLSINKKYNVSMYVDMKVKNEFLQRKKDGSKCLYKWKSIKPNIHMARKLYYFLYKEGQLRNKNLNNQKPVIKTTPKQEVTKKEISLFWGLIKIKY